MAAGTSWTFSSRRRAVTVTSARAPCLLATESERDVGAVWAATGKTKTHADAAAAARMKRTEELPGQALCSVEYSEVSHLAARNMTSGGRVCRRRLPLAGHWAGRDSASCLRRYSPVRWSIQPGYSAGRR